MILNAVIKRCKIIFFSKRKFSTSVKISGRFDNRISDSLLNLFFSIRFCSYVFTIFCLPFTSQYRESCGKSYTAGLSAPASRVDEDPRRRRERGRGARRGWRRRSGRARGRRTSLGNHNHCCNISSIFLLPVSFIQVLGLAKAVTIFPDIFVFYNRFCCLDVIYIFTKF